MAIERAELIARMRKFIKEGMSFNRFYEQRAKWGFTIRRANMLADWHDIKEIEVKSTLARGIKVGLVPVEAIAEMKNWQFKGLNEWLYKFAYNQIDKKGKVVKTGFVNITSVEAMAIEDAVAELWQRSFDQSPPISGEERIFTLESVFHSPKK